jgi:arylsulfatase A-like enzyme
VPTYLAAAGVPDIVEKLKNGYKANGKEWKVHLDGYNFDPYFQGKEKHHEKWKKIRTYNNNYNLHFGFPPKCTRPLCTGKTKCRIGFNG